MNVAKIRAAFGAILPGEPGADVLARVSAQPLDGNVFIPCSLAEVRVLAYALPTLADTPIMTYHQTSGVTRD